MGQSLVKNYIHIVFSTKHRTPMITPPYEEELHSYLGGICKNLECQPIKIGGYTDHIHILCMLSKKIALMKLLEEVKSHSSKWMKTKSELLNNFYWQDGYGAFSVNPSQVNTVIAYIERQHAHHSKKTFQDEYTEHFWRSTKWNMMNAMCGIRDYALSGLMPNAAGENMGLHPML